MDANEEEKWTDGKAKKLRADDMIINKHTSIVLKNSRPFASIRG
jgi:hypothetical protein